MTNKNSNTPWLYNFINWGKSGLYFLPFVILVSCVDKSDQHGTHLEKKEHLNVVWIVAEDLSGSVPSFGDSTIVTPHLSRLAKEGVCFDNFFTPSPVCAPARSAIITGMYPTRIGTSHMRTGSWFRYDLTYKEVLERSKHLPEGIVPYEGLPAPGVKMMSEYLRKAGYYCTNNSKEDYQFRSTLTAWDESSETAHWRNREEGQPFFSVFNLFVTHESRIWAKAGDSLWVANDLDVPVPPYLPDTEIAKKDIRRMYSNIKEMDAQVGKILKELEADGLLEKTVIFWYTDHGGPLPRQKRSLHDTGIKVPMIVRFPNKEKAGEREDKLLSFIDLAPTVMSLANIKPPGYMDGKAFLGPHKQNNGRDYIFAAADRFDQGYDTKRAIRDERYKLIRYYQTEKSMYLPVKYRDQMPIMQELHRIREEGTLTAEQALWFRENKPAFELFDVKNDPHEVNDLAGNEAFAAKINELNNALDGWIKDTKDRGLLNEFEYLNTIWPGLRQPGTEMPSISMNNSKVKVECETEGASIAYLVVPGKTPKRVAWNVYHQPFNYDQKDTLKIIAHRIGYLPSDTLVVKPKID